MAGVLMGDQLVKEGETVVVGRADRHHRPRSVTRRGSCSFADDCTCHVERITR